MRLLLLFVLLSLPRVVNAQVDAPPVRVELLPFDAAGPYKRRIRITSLRDQEVAVDRRLLDITVKPEGSRRRYRCRHPDAPRRGRTETMASGTTHEEWLDLRMYCWGRALDALVAGPATLEVRYGYASRGRGRFVAQVEGERRPMHRIELDPLAWTPPPQPGETVTPSVTLTLRPVSRRGAPTLRPSVRTSDPSARIYVRDDHFRFDVVGPVGRVHCERERQPINPIVDFFRRLRGRAYTDSLAADYFCPEDTFEVPGVYEITPTIELPYSGSEYGFEAVTGVFEGTPGVVRVRSTRYVVQAPEDLLRVLEAS